MLCDESRTRSGSRWQGPWSSGVTVGPEGGRRRRGGGGGGGGRCAISSDLRGLSTFFFIIEYSIYNITFVFYDEECGDMIGCKFGWGPARAAACHSLQELPSSFPTTTAPLLPLLLLPPPSSLLLPPSSLLPPPSSLLEKRMAATSSLATGQLQAQRVAMTAGAGKAQTTNKLPPPACTHSKFYLFYH